MNLLLDTYAFLWSMMAQDKLSIAARQELLNPENTVFVSAVTFWEIGMKHALGKLDLNGVTPSVLPDIAASRMGFQLVDLDAGTASRFGAISRLHGDPFDRMLIHQATKGDFCLVSADRQFVPYSSCGLKLLW